MRAIIILLTVFLCLFAMSTCSKKKEAQKEPNKIEEAVKDQNVDESNLQYRQEVTSFKLEGFAKNGENQWSVQGQFANIVDPDVMLKSIYGKSVSKQMSVTITADRGIYNKETRSAELKGNVIAVMSDGGRAIMDTAHWNAGDEEITTESPLRIEHSGIILVGVGGIVRPQKEWAMVFKNIRMCDTNGRVITCDGPLEVSYKEKKATLNNNVVIVDPEQGQISADTVIAYFDPEKKEIEKIEWFGNVKAVY